MRLKRLDLTRYGKFTGRVIDFGERASGQPDLHIVYGPNEAGKSTAFAAFLDLIFGIEARSRFNFLHPYQTMRIGGALELEADGAPREFVRIKRPQNSLLDANEQPVAEATLQGALGGLDRSAYRMMFSLDDETLEAGGESILESKGDLGQLLFSASAGLADLSRTLDDLRGETEAFYKYRARSGELSVLKAELGELKAERERIDTLASQYAQLVETRERASAQYEEAIAARGSIQARMDEIQRHLTALPRLAALRAVRAGIAPLEGLPEAPPGWLEALPGLQRDDIELATRAATAQAEIVQQTAELEAIAVDEAALALAGRIEQAAKLQARHVTAEADLPERRLQLRDAERGVTGLLARLGRAGETDPARLVLEASIVGTLRDLIETRSGIAVSAEAARREMSLARDRLGEATAKLDQASGNGSAGSMSAAQLAALTAAVSAIRAGDHAARHRLAERSARALRDTLAERIATLRPWAGDADQLAGLTVPEPADITGWKEASAKVRQQIERLEEDVARFQAERERHRAALDAITATAGIVGDREVAALRAERDGAWASHRQRLDAASADAFETTLRRDDDAASARLRHEKEIVRLRQLGEECAKAEADLGSTAKRLDAARQARATIGAAFAGALAAITPPLPESMTLAQLEAWLARRDKALEARASLRDTARELDEAGRDIAAAQRTLAAALDAAAVPHEADAGWMALLAAAQSALDREAELKDLRTALRECERELKSRERALEKAGEAEKRWQAAWTKACGASWLGEGDAAPSVSAVREILDAVADLGPRLGECAALAERIRKMEGDQASFAAEITEIARALGHDPAGEAPAALAHRIKGRVQQAHAAQATRAAKMQALDAAKARQRDIAEALSIHDKRKAEMTAFFAVDSLIAVGSRLQDAAKRAELRGQAEEATRDILDALRLPAIEAAEAALDMADRAAIEAELAALQPRFDDQDQRARDLFTAFSKAADRVDAVGGDNAAARIEEKRRTILLDVEERALRYLRLRAGIVAAEQALRAYREKHRSSMMARASNAFRTLSRDTYTSLATQLEKDSEILIAVPAAGGSKIAAELSKGTRFQLYLALRVAGYYEFAGSRPPVPFIADDIMETFDDFRAEEAFRLFAEMARVGQVIYLTHHHHLCDMARRIHPDVRVHDLSSAA